MEQPTLGLALPHQENTSQACAQASPDVDSPSIEVPFPQMSLVSAETAEMDTAHTRSRVAQFFL